MRIAIVGANGQVGTELCFLLRNDDLDIVPIVRNKLATGFLDYHGFKCRIADLCDDKDAEQVLGDIDIVVIAALAAGRSADRINKQLVRNAMMFSRPETRIIYFSSIRAFSSVIDANTPTFWFPPPYDREKRQAERYLRGLGRMQGKKWYALRLGHVLGVATSKTQDIKDTVNGRSTIYLRVRPDKPSNVLHMVTLKEVVELCAEETVKPGVYTVVNNPQWSWEEVFRFYTKEASLFFLEEDTNAKRDYYLRRMAYGLLKSLLSTKYRKYLKILSWYLPEKVWQTIRDGYSPIVIKNGISGLQRTDKPITKSEFAYKAALGPFFPGLSDTKSVLKDMDFLADIFAFDKRGRDEL